MPEELDILLGQKDKKILFVGIGNVLKNDDGAGVYISKQIINQKNIASLTVETGIENYIGKINSIDPDILVMIDCADMKTDAGTIRMVSLDDVQDLTFNTHNISLKKLRNFFKMPAYFLGIQPENLDFGENISYFVRMNSDLIIKNINQKGGDLWL